MPKYDASTHKLLAAFLVVAVSFIATTFYTQAVVAEIDSAAREIATNASPSIEHLAAARGETRRIETLLAEVVAVREAHEDADTRELEASRGILRTELGAYFAQPTFPGERDSWALFHARAIAFDATVAHAEEEASRGNFEIARRLERKDVNDAADALSDSAMEIITLNAHHGHNLAIQALKLRERAQILAIVLSLACLAISLGAFEVTRRAKARSEEVAADHARYLKARSEELESFAGRVAHDVMNPLGAIKLSIAALGRQTRSLPQLGETIARAERSVVRATQIVDALLLFARSGAKPESDAMAPLDSVVAGIFEEMRPDGDRADVAIAAELGDPAPSLACSEGVLISILSNLVRNAIKYMGDAVDRRVVIRARTHGARIRVEVEDTGPGIPLDAQGSIFDAFVRAANQSQPGIGLGLATVKRLVEGHGGTVGLVSDGVRGSIFWFELPPASRGAVSNERVRLGA